MAIRQEVSSFQILKLSSKGILVTSESVHQSIKSKFYACFLSWTSIQSSSKRFQDQENKMTLDVFHTSNNITTDDHAREK